MSYEYIPANLGNPLYGQASQAAHCPGVIQKPPGSQPSTTTHQLQSSSALASPSSTQPQVFLPTSTSGPDLHQSSVRGEEFECGGVLQPSGGVLQMSKGVLQPSGSTPNAASEIVEYGAVLQSAGSATPNVALHESVLLSSSSSISTPNVASANLLRQLVLDRPKMPLSRLMQVSYQRLQSDAFLSLRRSRPTL